jgi:hypothetical protein
MIKNSLGRRRSLGLASGSIWLIVCGTVFATVSLVLIGTPTATAFLVGTLIAAATLLTIGVSVFRAALRLPDDVAPRTAAEQAIGRRFAMIVAAEVIALAVVNPVAAVMQRFELMASLNLVIVGIHFLPLASIFQVPRYYLMGALFCIIPAVTLLTMPAHALVGHALGWLVVPSLGCSVVAGLTGAVGLRDVRESVIESRA